MSVLLNQSSLTDLLNHLSLCNQGIGNIAKKAEDEVKRHGVKGVTALKDDGVEGSFVSFRQACLITQPIISYNLFNPFVCNALQLSGAG
jgi:hypothetical protein